jgi:hypothetical protein
MLAAGAKVPWPASPTGWTLADAEGNEVDVTAATGATYRGRSIAGDGTVDFTVAESPKWTRWFMLAEAGIPRAQVTGVTPLDGGTFNHVSRDDQNLSDGEHATRKPTEVTWVSLEPARAEISPTRADAG